MVSIITPVVIFLLLNSNLVVAQSIGQPSRDRFLSAKQDTQTDKTDKTEESLDFSGTGRPGQQTAGESRSSCAKR